METIVIHFKDNPVTLRFSEIEDIDMDSVTKIDYSNIFGEAVTVSALLNNVGILKAEAESIYQEKKLEFDIYEAEKKKFYRRDATDNGGKFNAGTEEKPEWVKLTESALDEAIVADKGWQVKKKNVIKSQKDLGFIDSLYWSVQSKDKKLNNIMKEVTPTEFYNQLIEGKINGFTIKKSKLVR